MGVIADKIRKAIFGGEVRDSIADGIEVVEQLREDYDRQVINAGNSNAEIVDARGGKAKLKDRLDGFDASLAEIATIEIVADIDGTSYKAGDKVDIEMLRQIQNKNFFTFMKKIRNREVLKIVCQGDSLTYGSDVTSADKRPASGVVNSDGSQSGVTRASITYPEALENYLNQVYRSTVIDKLITVETRAYPGDWAPKSFNRHFLKHDGDLTIIMLGTNDSRRANYEDAGDIGVFYYWLEQIIIRELLWDKAVLLLTPTKELSLDLAVDAFSNAVHGLGNKYNAPVIDTDEFVSQYPASIYSDETHFKGTGYSIVASRTASTLVGEGAHKPKYVLPGSVLLTRRTLDNVSLVWNAGYSGSTSSYAPSPNELEIDKSLNVLLNADNGEMIYSFYAMNENLIVIPNMFVSSNANVTVELDFGVPQAQNALDSVLNEYAIEEEVPNKLEITQPSSTWIRKKYYLDNSLEPLRITQKGWHTIRIKTTVASTAVYGLEFLSFQEWDNAKKLKTLIS